MRVKKVPLQDLELWPDEVICFSAYTDTRNPVQQRRTYVDGAALEAENETLRAERDEWHRVAESKQDIIDHMRDANAENAKLRQQLANVIESMGRVEERCAKLRELANAAHSCKTNDGCCEDCYCDEGCCPIERRMQELGIEVR